MSALSYKCDTLDCYFFMFNWLPSNWWWGWPASHPCCGVRLSINNLMYFTSLKSVFIKKETLIFFVLSEVILYYCYWYFIIFISICNHNQHTLYELFYYMTTRFDLELGSSSGPDRRIWVYTETKYHKLEISSCTLNMYVKCTRVQSITMWKREICNLWCLFSVDIHILVSWPDGDGSCVRTGCHIIILFIKCVLVVTENIDKYWHCYTHGNVSFKCYRSFTCSWNPILVLKCCVRYSSFLGSN